MKRTTIAALLLCSLCVLSACADGTVKAKKEYKDIEKLELEFDYENVKAYQIGADRKGNPVFYDPQEALKQAEKDFAEGLWYLKAEYGLQDVEKDYEAYKEYGWQVETSDEVIESQCRAISSFLDIYENSFE